MLGLLFIEGRRGKRNGAFSPVRFLRIVGLGEENRADLRFSLENQPTDSCEELRFVWEKINGKDIDHC
jgi:hypothetical protein